MKRWAVRAVIAGIVLAMPAAPAYAKDFAGAIIQGGGPTVQVAKRSGNGGLEDLAGAGSLVCTPPGQTLFGQSRRGGWTESGVNLARFPRAYGIRVTDERAAVPAQESGPGRLPVSASAAGVVVVLLAGRLLLLRRRRSAARSSVTT